MREFSKFSDDCLDSVDSFAILLPQRIARIGCVGLDEDWKHPAAISDQGHCNGLADRLPGNRTW